jgi:hypothetical protein
MIDPKKIIIVFLLLSVAVRIHSKAASSGTNTDTVSIGMYINSIYDLNFEERSYKIDYWLWCIYKNKNIPVKDWIEFPGTKSFQFTNIVQEEKDGYQWLTMRGTGEVLHDWDAKSFPFDVYKLTVTIGLSTSINEVTFIADDSGSMFDPDFKLLDWKLDSVRFKSTKKTYSTSFGDPSGNSLSLYPEFKTNLYISRVKPWSSLVKYVMGLIIAFLISICVFFITPTNTDPRFGLCVGGLFTAVGNKYITDSLIPLSSGISLLDKLHHLTFLCIFLTVIISVINLRLLEKNEFCDLAKIRSIDHLWFGIISIVFFGGFMIILS